MFAVLVLALAAPQAARPATPPPGRPPLVSWRTIAPAPDRLQHAGLGFAIAAGAGIATRSPWAGAGLSLSLGVVKELVDGHGDRLDAGDLVADALGAALGAVAIGALRR